MIDVQAYIDPKAKIAPNVTIGPWTWIGPDVEIDEGTTVGAHVVIKGPTKIGKDNRIFQFASIGDDPQDISYQGETTYLDIGDRNLIREYCMINRGTKKGGSITKIGHDNYFMAHTHVGHDCHLGNHTILTNHAALSGHATIDDYAIIGAYSAVHQFCHVGEHAFVGKSSYVTKDVLPYIIVDGRTPTAYGVNSRGLKRRGFTSETIDGLKRAYKIIFRQGLTVSQALAKLDELVSDCPDVAKMMAILTESERGIIR